MKYDVCIIGAGPAGYSGALKAAREGKTVALVERDKPGGTCLNRGCIPTKALRQCADSLVAARGSGRFGVVLGGEPSFDYARAAEFRDEVTASLVKGVSGLIKAAKVKLVQGPGKIVKPGLVTVDSAEGRVDIECLDIVIASGSRPSDLPNVPIDEETTLSSEGALSLDHAPGSLIIIGAGVIGLEFADIFATFGSRVTVVEALPRVLMNEDRASAKVVQKALEKSGIKFMLGATVEDLEVGPEVKCALDNGETVSADKMIVSVGRRPAIGGLGLEEAGVETANGAVKVDGRGATSAPGIWAAGDAIGPPMLAHVAAHEMEVVIDNLIGKHREFKLDAIPWVTFTRPEIAAVGLGEDKAREEKIPIKVGRFGYAAAGKAQCMGETEGFVKVVADPGTGRILGGSIIGAHASDLIAELSAAVQLGVTVHELAEVIHAHPTLSEMVMEAAADSFGLALHKAAMRK